MEELKNSLLDKMHVRVYHEDENQKAYNTYHHFQFKNAGSGEYLGELKFQKGGKKEVGINGVSDELVLAVVLERLNCIQEGDFSNRETAIAITKIEEALLWLKKRTIEREEKGIEGTNRKG